MNGKAVTVKDYTREYFELRLRARRETRDWAEIRIRDVLPFAEPSEKDVIADVGCGIGTFVIECAKNSNSINDFEFSGYNYCFINTNNKIHRIFYSCCYSNLEWEQSATFRNSISTTLIWKNKEETKIILNRNDYYLSFTHFCNYYRIRSFKCSGP